MKKLLLLITAIMTLSMSAFAQNRTISGVVLDSETDEPLIAATVMPVGSGQGTSTDFDGRFTLSIPATVKEIQVSYVGYQTTRVPVASDMTIKLVNNNTLSEVVAIGYGSAKKLGSIVGSVSVVGEDALENIPTATFVDALQGQVSGLSIFSASGDPSSVDNNIRLRGVNSISAGNTPLFILDGAPVTESVFTTLNPSDIENITVLKDAASVAIYGSRAANGVIVITSKTGKMGERPKVSIRANVGWSTRVQDKMDMMNSEEYINYRDYIGAPVTQDMRDAWEKYGIDTDWMSEVFNGHAPTYSVEGAITGGGDNLSYYLSLNHYSADGIIAQSSMRRESLRVNLRSRITDWLRVGFQSNLGYTKYETNNESNAIYSGDGVFASNPMVVARKVFPMQSPYYYTIDENGDIHYGDKAEYLVFNDAITPDLVASIRSYWRNKVTVNATLYEELMPIDGLRLRAQQNVDAYDYRADNKMFPREDIVTPDGHVFDWQGKKEGFVAQSFSRYYAFTYTNTAEYNRLFNNKHDMTILLGQESIIARSSAFSVSSEGQDDRRLMLLQNGTSVTIGDISNSYAAQVFNSFFINGSYNYDNRYFFEATFRRDGSSKFVPGNRWANFFSLGAMWNMKQEKFLQPYTWLDMLQFHASYGTTGNSSISNYMFYGLVGAYTLTYNGGNAWGIAQAPNNDLSWETVRSLDIGFNFGFWKILSGEIDFYNKNTVDMLLTIPYSYTTGYSSGFGNIGSMRNTGMDLDLRADIIKTRDWYWALRANLNYNHNEITKLYDDQDELTIANTGTQYKVGHSSGSYYMVEWAGIDPRDGQQMWYDKDGNLTKVYNEEEDARLLDKTRFSPISGGFGTDLRWKGLALRVDFSWAGKKYMINNDRYFCENNNFATSFNQMASMLDVWTTPGQVTNIPAADGQVLHFDTHLLENASFMRLKNVTLSYSLPQNILSKLYLQALTVHFTGRNLWTVTNYTGYDPEPESNVVAFYYPNTRQFEFGLEVTF